MADLSTRKRLRSVSVDPDLDSLDVKKLRDDLLSFLDDSDPDPTAQALDSVIKSFQDEISPASSRPVLLIDRPVDSAESTPELGYLLEASDDELGLPPSVTSTSQVAIDGESKSVHVSSELSGIGEYWGFEDRIPAYDSFELAEEYKIISQMKKAEYVAFDGLFDPSDLLYYEPSDFSEYSWRYETMPAQ